LEGVTSNLKDKIIAAGDERGKRKKGEMFSWGYTKWTSAPGGAKSLKAREGRNWKRWGKTNVWLNHSVWDDVGSPPCFKGRHAREREPGASGSVQLLQGFRVTSKKRGEKTTGYQVEQDLSEKQQR